MSSPPRDSPYGSISINRLFGRSHSESGTRSPNNCTNPRCSLHSHHRFENHGTQSRYVDLSNDHSDNSSYDIDGRLDRRLRNYSDQDYLMGFRSYSDNHSMSTDKYAKRQLMRLLREEKMMELKNLQEQEQNLIDIALMESAKSVKQVESDNDSEPITKENITDMIKSINAYFSENVMIEIEQKHENICGIVRTIVSEGIKINHEQCSDKNPDKSSDKNPDKSSDKNSDKSSDKKTDKDLDMKNDQKHDKTQDLDKKSEFNKPALRVTSSTDVDTVDTHAISKTKNHIDFIVGRGRHLPVGCLNIPLNKSFNTRNIVYIDQDPFMCADIRLPLHEVDFESFGICNNMNNLNDVKDNDSEMSLIDVRIIFDWSSFYCGALKHMHTVVKKIGCNFQILVPMYPNENTIPKDIFRELADSRKYDIKIVNGEYPLFDWSVSKDNTLGVASVEVRSILRNRIVPISQFVNPKKYIEINVFNI